jgi:UDP-GlcNAc3NAcA epimerase
VQTGRIMERLEPVVMGVRPDWVLVYGDTNSTLAGALVAAKCHIPVAHVEAGLRSFDRRMPEEVNRVLTDHLSSRLFAPTPTAVANLEAEGIRGARVRVVGDVMYDAVQMFGGVAGPGPEVLAAAGLAAAPFALATIHRAENTDDPARLAVILDALARISRDLPVLWPVHPRLRDRVLRATLPPQVHRVEPLPYVEMLRVQQRAALVVTDSGGLQKEAFFARVPCVTLRDTTEWVETVALGWNRLVPVVDGVAVARAALSAVGVRGGDAAPYGDGHAAGRIAADLQEPLA